MEYSILIEKIDDGSLPEGYFYAHIPALDLTTHGFGIENAKKAAEDLVNLWIEEKLANSEPIPRETESYFSKIEVSNALHGA
ncbi:MAG: type II toxin-antitoxin system HicB family antitoxin [Spirochaetes bacterium]|nr:MAG: type II toxin-antitoxin system HicB family antitoxin [Spirochaetota bacterium]